MFERLLEKLNLKSVKTAKILLFGAIGVVAIFAALYINDMRNTATQLVEADLVVEVETHGYAAEGGQIEMPPQTIVVSVTGEVHSPGVFELYEGARINDAINAAGGMTSDADPNAINLAARLADEQHIIVFNFADNMPPSVQATSGDAGIGTGGLININTATSEQLQVLSGVGPVTAENIIRHREARGGFGSIEEIMNVSGIGERTFEGIRDSITVD